ncbi:MAG: YhjD/YihY/BrkB family envelope integrity protein, partial [Candidatus Latescibacterota bacterium]|nr:YhjD/YihY/BrkB family envelope integrity protein [Candidatus Latescibacterota bacterium]
MLTVRPEASHNGKGSNTSGRQTRWRLRSGATLARLLRSAYDNDIGSTAGAMAFDFVFAIFPGILVLTALLSIMDISAVAFGSLLDDMGVVLPEPLRKIVIDQVQRITEVPSGSLFFIGLLGVLW